MSKEMSTYQNLVDTCVNRYAQILSKQYPRDDCPLTGNRTIPVCIPSDSNMSNRWRILTEFVSTNQCDSLKEYVPELLEYVKDTDIILRVLCVLIGRSEKQFFTHNSANVIITLGESLLTPLSDGGMAVEDVSLFYDILRVIVKLNSHIRFEGSSLEQDDIRMKMYRWIDYCYTYKALSEEKNRFLNDIATAYESIVYPLTIANQDSRKETINDLKSVPDTEEHQYGIYMNNFLDSSFTSSDTYNVFCSADKSIVRNVRCGNKIPFFTLSLLCRTRSSYDNLASYIKIHYGINTLVGTNSDLLTYRHPTVQALSKTSSNDAWKEINRLELSNSNLSYVNNFYNTISNDKLYIIGKEGPTENIGVSNNKNILCDTISQDTFRLRNCFDYIPDKGSSANLFYKKLYDDKLYINDNAETSNNNLFAGNFKKTQISDMLVTNSNLSLRDKKIIEYVRETLGCTGLSVESQIKIFLGSSGAGKSTNIGALIGCLTSTKNIYAYDSMYKFSNSFQSMKEVLDKMSDKSLVGAKHPYIALNNFSTLGSNKKCQSVVAASTENKTSSRNSNVYNLVYIDRGIHKMPSKQSPELDKVLQYELAYCNSLTVVDTMGFENVIRFRHGQKVYQNPLDYILLPYLTGIKWTDEDLDKFLIPRSEVTANAWKISNYRQRFKELINSFNTILAFLQSLSDKRIDIGEMIKKLKSDPQSIPNNELLNYLIEYNLPKYNLLDDLDLIIRKSTDLVRQEVESLRKKMQQTMRYKIDILLMLSMDSTNRERDRQLFNLLRLLSPKQSIPVSIKHVITKEHLMLHYSRK